MKKIITTILLIGASLFANAQFKVGLKLLPYGNLASVKDRNGTTSSIDRRGDGYTVKADNEGGFGIGITVEYLFNDNFSFLTGLTFITKNYHIGNYDGFNGPFYYPNYPFFYNYNGTYYANGTNYSYYGTSRYQTTYMQLPLIIKYTSKELFPKFRIYVALGPTIDIKMSEKLAPGTGDYAHYWNMAQNNPTWADRDRNASGRKVGLFNPFDFGILFNIGATYEVIENLDVYAGFMLNKGFVNQVNPKLRFAEPTQTKVNSDVSWKSCLIGAEIGVSYKLSK